MGDNARKLRSRRGAYTSWKGFAESVACEVKGAFVEVAKISKPIDWRVKIEFIAHYSYIVHEPFNARYYGPEGEIDPVAGFYRNASTSIELQFPADGLMDIDDTIDYCVGFIQQEIWHETQKQA